MHKQTKRALILTIAILFLLFGLVGFVLPILQGVLFVTIGFILLSFCFPQFRPSVHRHVKKYPHLAVIIEKTETRIAKIFGEV